MNDKATARQRAKAAALAPSSAYPPGHFASVIKPSSTWMRGWAPVLTKTPAEQRYIDGLHRLRLRQSSEGGAHGGWGNGTIDLPGTPLQPKPAMMQRKKG